MNLASKPTIPDYLEPTGRQVGKFTELRMKNEPYRGSKPLTVHIDKGKHGTNYSVMLVPYHGPKEKRVENKGWLKIWWIAEMPGEEPPARRQYCSRREVAGILKYWQSTCPLTLMKSEYRPDVTSVLDKVLQVSPLDKIMGL